MSYKDLLVYVDTLGASDKAIDAALRLAQKFDAHLTGLFLNVRYFMPSYVGAAVPTDMIEQVNLDREKQAEEVKARYLAMAEAHGRNGDFRIEDCVAPGAADMVGLHGRYSDLIILSQPDPDSGTPATDMRLIEDVVLESGRPAFVVPYIGVGKTIGKRVAVAWDSGREAARAVSDAMPFLQAADEVSILVVSSGDKKGGHGEEPGADIARHLARHGVKCEVNRFSHDGVSVGEAILSRLSDLNSDLLIMGAYGHHRWRELVLGGVTRTIFQSMPIPVLMSH